MKVTVKKPVEIDVKWVDICFPVDSDDLEANDDLADLVEVGYVRMRIDIETGVIDGFRGNPSTDYDIQVKVVDRGEYQLIGPDYNVVAELMQDYVPHGVVPGWFGDYIKLKIDGSTARITNWPKKPDVSAFFPDED